MEKENELKEMEIKKNRLFLFGLLGIVLLIIIVAYLIIKQNKIKSEQRTIQVEQKLLRSQMNPHFIFNSLSSIQYFIVMKNHIKQINIFLVLPNWFVVF